MWDSFGVGTSVPPWSRSATKWGGSSSGVCTRIRSDRMFQCVLGRGSNLLGRPLLACFAMNPHRTRSRSAFATVLGFARHPLAIDLTDSSHPRSLLHLRAILQKTRKWDIGKAVSSRHAGMNAVRDSLEVEDIKFLGLSCDQLPPNRSDRDRGGFFADSGKTKKHQQPLRGRRCSGNCSQSDGQVVSAIGIEFQGGPLLVRSMVTTLNPIVQCNPKN